MLLQVNMGTINYKDPSLLVSVIANGAMSAADKVKLNGLSTSVDVINNEIQAILGALDGYGSGSLDGYATITYVNSSIQTETNRAIVVENKIKSVLDGYSTIIYVDGYVASAVQVETERAIVVENEIKSVLDGYKGIYGEATLVDGYVLVNVPGGIPVGSTILWSRKTAIDFTGEVSILYQNTNEFVLISSSNYDQSIISWSINRVVTGYYVPMTWFVNNWGETDWYLDAVSGNDNNVGTYLEFPLRTVEELSRRLAIPISFSHIITVHIAQGTYGMFSVKLNQSSNTARFLVSGQSIAAGSLTVGTYTVWSHLTATGCLLSVPGMDFSELVGYRLRRL
jgi:hypothetical protein